MTTEIVLQNPRRYRSLEPRRLRGWLSGLLGEVAPQAVSFGVRFVDDGEMCSLNRHFRARDRPTDVLSFPGEASAEGLHLGDVVISVPTARRQAAAVGSAEVVEIRTLLLHGVLHCLGYDHEADKGEMESLERRLRRKWIENVD